MVWVEDMLACSGVANEGDANSVSLNSSAWDLPTCTPPAHPVVLDVLLWALPGQGRFPKVALFFFGAE